MITFLLNNKVVSTDLATGTTLLDYIRYHQNMTGTKIGCREGDCGACTVLIGRIREEELVYESVTSCLMPLGNVHLKHVVTIEGVNMDTPNMIQEIFVQENASQCGFCTPGFIVSLTGGCLNGKATNLSGSIDSMNGNICRCTGYKSIQRAAEKVSVVMQSCSGENYLEHAVQNKIIPEYFTTVETRLKNMIAAHRPLARKNSRRKVAGGTDLYVQQHETIVDESPELLSNHLSNRYIAFNHEKCTFGYATTVADLASNKILQTHIQGWNEMIQLVSSTQIRNMATVTGNFVNASPIGDFSVLFLALDAQLTLKSSNTERNIPLKEFFLGYKQKNIQEEEHIDSVTFSLPDNSTQLSFEKVSKRTHLDIASVNTACCVRIDKNIITHCALSAGGVSAIPLYLKESSRFMTGKTPENLVLKELLEIVQSEISPISDARGSAAYKRLLLNKLITTHWMKFFPNVFDLK